MWWWRRNEGNKIFEKNVRIENNSNCNINFGIIQRAEARGRVGMSDLMIRRVRWSKWKIEGNDDAEDHD